MIKTNPQKLNIESKSWELKLNIILKLNPEVKINHKNEKGTPGLELNPRN